MSAVKCGVKEPMLIIGPGSAEDLRQELVGRIGKFIPKSVVEGKKESTCS